MMDASQSKGEKDMRYIYTGLAASAAVVLLSGVAPTEADASAKMGGEVQTESQPQHENSWQQDDFHTDLHSYFHNWYQDREDNNWDQQETEQPDDDQSEAPNDEEKNEVPEIDEDQTGDDEQADNSDLGEFEQEVVDLTNQEREKNGLQPLKVDNELSGVARDKSSDMQQNNYFDHNSPTHGSPFDMMDSYGIDYTSAAENIAKGQPTPEEVVDGWMNSDGHRENILDGSFTHIGVGFIEQGNVWTQQFIAK